MNLIATGRVVGEAAEDLANRLRHLDPHEHRHVTVDLREATAIDPVVMHALLQAWERRDHEWGTVRVQVAAGDVARFLDALGLERAVDIDRSGGDAVEEERATWADDRERRRQVLEGSLAHYRHLLDLAYRQDLEALRAAAQEAHPICVASGAEETGPAFGEWCERCPLQHSYGGCYPLITQMVRSAELGNWEAAQLLILSLIAQAAGVDALWEPPGAEAGSEP